MARLLYGGGNSLIQNEHRRQPSSLTVGDGSKLLLIGESLTSPGNSNNKGGSLTIIHWSLTGKLKESPRILINCGDKSRSRWDSFSIY